MIEINWNNVKFTITDIGGGILGEEIPRHSHAKNCYELHFITNGKGTLKTDDKTYLLKQGDFFITGPNVYHSQDFDKEHPVEDVFILLQAENTNKANMISSVFLQNVFCYFEKFDMIIPQMILSEFRQKKPDCESAIAGLTIKVLTDITRLMLPDGFINSADNQNLNDRRFVIIEQYFLYEKDLTLSELSKRIGLCERQTQRLLKKYYNKSFREKKAEQMKIC